MLHIVDIFHKKHYTFYTEYLFYTITFAEKYICNLQPA